MKQAFLVVGTGRSGTSAMAGTLRILGAQLGEQLKPGDAFNPKGYFENTQITTLNKKLLSSESMVWYESPPEKVHPVPVISAHSTALRNCIVQTFGEGSPIAIKDPRLCVLLDIYVSTLREMGYVPHCVRMVRDPVEVTKSLIAAAGPGESRWLPMVKRHTELLDAAIKSTSVNHVDCTFTDLVTRTEDAVLMITQRFPFLSCSTKRMREVLDFIDGSLKHHNLPGDPS